jgi:adenylate cyclase class 2
MLEVELKFRVHAGDELARTLKRMGALEKGVVEQVDEYFAHPNRNFAETDEALRVRRVGQRNLVTYKGPKIDAMTKTRREIELPLASGNEAADDFRELLTALGFRPVATVRKTRVPYELTRGSRAIEIALDQVDDLGMFAEIETAAPESELDTARQVITSLAGELGLDTGERRSYLELLLERRGTCC